MSTFVLTFPLLQTSPIPIQVNWNNQTYHNFNLMMLLKVSLWSALNFQHSTITFCLIPYKIVLFLFFKTVHVDDRFVCRFVIFVHLSTLWMILSLIYIYTLYIVRMLSHWSIPLDPHLAGDIHVINCHCFNVRSSVICWYLFISLNQCICRKESFIYLLQD